MITDARAPSQNLAELSEQLDSLTSRRAQLQARVSQLDTTIAEVQELAGEVETWLRSQESEVARLMTAAGNTISFGANHTQRTVTWTDGRGTQQLSGPRPMDSAQGKADHARRVYAALEDEAQPIRSTLIRLQNERQEAKKAIGLLGGEINGLEGQLARIRAEEEERVELIGRLTWRDRLAAILRRIG